MSSPYTFKVKGEVAPITPPSYPSNCGGASASWIMLPTTSGYGILELNVSQDNTPVTIELISTSGIVMQTLFNGVYSKDTYAALVYSVPTGAYILSVQSAGSPCPAQSSAIIIR